MDPQPALDHRAQVAAFQRKHRTALLTLLFTDLVGSTRLKHDLGDSRAVALMQQHHALLRDILNSFPEAEEISTAGDSFFLVFTKPSDAVKFSLLLQNQLRALAQDNPHPLLDRIGIHVGEVIIEERADAAKPKDLYGIQVDMCARVMSLAEAGQILLPRAAFDSARQVLKGQDIEGLGPLSWLNHGPYVLKGVEEPLEVCEVGETTAAPLKPPPDSEKVHRHVSPDSEPVLGWRPAIGQTVPNTRWVLEEKLGEGGFGEVWLGRHETLKERRVFKFCFRAERVRSLRREVTLFRVLKEKAGEHPHIVVVEDVYFDEPPYYLMMEYVPGRDLPAWCAAQGGLAKVPVETRLEIVAQMAEALQAAHEAGVIHRDVKPSNILVSQLSASDSQPLAKLTDFGIGQVMSQEVLAGMTRMGFTQTMMTSGTQSGSQMYMAPELLAGQPASPRSDLYSLGVVLYQLLVGDFARPVTTDWAKAIKEPLLREDLQQCFAGDVGERFASTGQLAVNLRSFAQRRVKRAAEQAAMAARERAAYRRGLVRATAVGAAIIAVMAGLLFYAVRQTQVAKTEALKSRKTAEFLRDMLAGVRPSVAMGRDTTMLKEILDRAAERVGKDLKDQPEVEADLRDTIGWTYRVLGRFELAQPHLEQTLTIRRRLLGEEDLATLRAMNTLASLYRAQGKFAEAELLITKALAGRRRILGEEHPDTLTSMRNLAWLYKDQRKYVEAEPLITKALEVSRRVLGEEQSDTLYLMNDLASLYQAQGKLAEAEPLITKALEVSRRVLGEEHSDTLYAMNDLASLYQAQGKLAEAESLRAQALEKQRRVWGEEHPDTLASMRNLARLYKDQRKYVEAEPLITKALDVSRRVLGEEHSNTLYAMNDLASLYRAQGKLAEAELLHRQCLAGRMKISPDSWLRFSSESNLGAVLLDQKKLTEAEPLLRSGYEGMKAPEAKLPAAKRGDLKLAIQRLVQLYEAKGDVAQTIEWKRKLAEFQKAPPAGDPPP